MPSYNLGEFDLGPFGGANWEVKFRSSLHKIVDKVVLGSRLIPENLLIAS